jgi:hypothetical protein
MRQRAPSEEGKERQARRGTSLNRKNEVLIERNKRVVDTYLSDSQAERNNESKSLS